VGDLIRQLLSLEHDGVALDGPDGEETYADLARRARGVRDALRSAGAGPGRAVVLLQERDRLGVAGLLGCLQAGACAVPLSPGLPPARIAALLLRAGPAAVLAHGRGLRPMRYLAKRGAPLPPCFEIKADDEPAPLSLEAPAGPSVELPEQGALALFAAPGLHGTPRALVHSWETLELHLRWAAELLGAGPEDRSLALAPLDHPAAPSQLLLPLALGARAVLTATDPPPGPLTLPVFMEQRGVTLACVPRLLASRMADGARGRDLAGLRHLVVLGDDPRPSWQPALVDALPGTTLHTLLNGGDLLALAHSTAGQQPPDEADAALATGPGLELSIAGPGLVPAPAGSPGEIWASGPAVPLGHLNDPVADHVLIIRRAGRRWLRARRVAVMDAAGQLVPQGARGRVLEVAGEPVDLLEVEDALCCCHGVTAAAVTAFTHPRMGCTLRAVVRGDPEGPARNALERCQLLLPEDMVPERLLVLERLPRRRDGGVDRDEVARLLS